MIDALFSPTVTAIGATVLHSLWQATLLALGLWLASRYLRFSPARRYQLAFAALLLQLFISVFTFYFVYESAAPLNSQAAVSMPIIDLIAVETTTTELAASSWQIPPTVYLALTGIWLLGLIFGGTRLLFGHCYTNFFYRRQLTSLPAAWQEMVKRLVKQLDFGRQTPQLALSARVNSPALIGLMKPLILLPIAMVNQLTTAQVEAVLAHELSHLAYQDHWMNFVQSVIEVLFYFNPAVHWISHQVRDEREHRVDAHVAKLGIDPLLYAKTLFLLEEQRHLAPAIALAARPGSLLGRVQRLLQNTPNHYRMKPGLLLLLLLLVTTLFSFSNADESLTAPPSATESALNWEEENEGLRPQSSIAFTEGFASMKSPASTTFSTERMASEAAMLQDTTPPAVISRQEIISSDNGREISIKKINGKVTYLEIDGKVIPKEKYADYQGLINAYTAPPPPPPAPVAPRAPRAPRAPMAPRAPQAPNGDSETRTYRWEQRSETDGEETENNSLFFQFFGEDGDVKMAFPGMDSVMIVNPNLDDLDFPSFNNLLRGNGMTEEETLELQEQLQGMVEGMFELRSLGDESIFKMDSLRSSFRFLLPENAEIHRFEFDDEDVFEFNNEGEDREIIREFRFESDADLESLRDRNSSGLFGAGEGSVHRISAERFISLAKNFQRRGLIKDEPIEKFSISEKRMKINGKKVDQSVMDRFKKEYAAKYRLDWDKDLGSFEINLD